MRVLIMIRRTVLAALRLQCHFSTRAAGRAVPKAWQELEPDFNPHDEITSEIAALQKTINLNCPSYESIARVVLLLHKSKHKKTLELDTISKTARRRLFPKDQRIANMKDYLAHIIADIKYFEKEVRNALSQEQARIFSELKITGEDILQHQEMLLDDLNVKAQSEKIFVFPLESVRERLLIKVAYAEQQQPRIE